MDNKEIFRLVLINLMNEGLLNKFLNIVFNYNLTENEYIYAQYKIVNKELILDIFDSSKNKRFDVYIFKENGMLSPVETSKDNVSSINYVDIETCYNAFIKGNKLTNIIRLGASLKVKNIQEFNKLIDGLFPEEINKLIYDTIKKESSS